MIRRIRVAATAGARWALAGHADADGNLETDDAELFPGVGFFARPKASHRTEAVLVKVGGEDGHSVIVATRNHDGVKLLGSLAEDETAIFNSRAAVVVKADGTIEIRSISGTAAPLATKADLNALRSAISGAAVTPNDGGAALKTNILAALPEATWPAGTTKLRGE